ncbi:MAG: DUF1800 domain-containing protein [Myxococcota bacterium]
MDAYVATTRFGLGARPGDLAIARARGPREWVLGQLAHPDPSAGARLAGLAGSADRVVELARMRAEDVPRSDARKAQRDQFADEQATHLVVAATSATPYVERLVAFWANHLTVSIGRKEVAPLASAYEREVIRPNLDRTFGDLVLASARSPAMLAYLDNAKSVGPESSAGMRKGRGLNENYARELLELHTLGVSGGYGQADVEALARLLTGWTVDVLAIPKPAPLVTMSTPTGGFVFDPSRHQPGPQTVLGRSFDDAEAAIAMLATHPSTARHVATRLARHFVADDPPPDAVAALERVFLDTGGSLPALHRAVVGLDAAWVPATKVKTPWELVVSAARALGMEVAQSGDDLLKSVKRLGQLPYDAPSPQGWSDRAVDWVTPGGMLARLAWADEVGRRLPPRDVAALLDDVLGPALTPTTRAAVAAAPRASSALTIGLMSPEFHRR